MVASRANRTRRRMVASRRVARAPSALSSPSSRSIALSVRRASLRRSSHARVVAVVAIRASRPGAVRAARARSIDRSRNHRAIDRATIARSIDRPRDRSTRASDASIAPLEALFREKAIATATIRRGVRASQKRDATATREELRAVDIDLPDQELALQLLFLPHDDGVESSIDRAIESIAFSRLAI